MSQQFQPPPGQWVWQPAPQPQTTPEPDTRLCRNGWEWLLFIADCAAIAIIFLVALIGQIQAGWRWPML